MNSIEISLAFLTDTLEGDASGARDVMRCFLGTIPQYVSAITSAVDAPTLHRALHTLKGGLLTLGAGHIASFVAELEGECLASQTIAMDRLVELRARLDQAASEIEALLAPSST